jgi:hypothetical protein
LRTLSTTVCGFNFGTKCTMDFTVTSRTCNRSREEEEEAVTEIARREQPKRGASSLSTGRAAYSWNSVAEAQQNRR